MFNEVKNKIARDADKSIYRIVYNFSLISEIHLQKLLVYKNRNKFYNAIIGSWKSLDLPELTPPSPSLLRKEGVIME
jgi:hypothetical protein